MKREKVLLIYTGWSVFVKNDFDILSKSFEVTRFQFKPARGMLAVVVQLIKQCWFLLINIRRYKTVLIWFADQHAILPVLFAKIFRKRSLLVVGGYDVCRISYLNYGVFCSRLRGFAAAWSMKNATINLPVSTNVARKVRAITRRKDSRIVFNCAGPVSRNSQNTDSRKHILTVALIDSERTYLIKGIDLFVEAARLLPGLPFTIVGFDQSKLSHLSGTFPENVILVPPLPHDTLSKYFKDCKIYCQLSRSESFGIALAEAILHGSLPVITSEGGMPEVVGNKQFIVPKDPGAIAAKISELYSTQSEAGSIVQQRVKHLFSIEQRENALLGLLTDIQEKLNEK